MNNEFDEKAVFDYVEKHIDESVEYRDIKIARWQHQQCQAEAATLHLAYEARIDEVIQERDKLLEELKEQCRINGIGQERELALMTDNKRFREYLDLIRYTGAKQASELATEALAIGDKVGE